MRRGFFVAFETTNAAFMENERSAEIVRCLKDVIKRLETGSKVMDSNGNAVGRYGDCTRLVITKSSITIEE